MEFRSFPVGEENKWVFNAYLYWYNNICNRQDMLNNAEYQRWLKTTYNLEWHQHSHGVEIVSYSREEWMRFYLEWYE